MSHHATLSPSKLGAMELCGSYESSGFSANAQAGTLKHEAIAEILEQEKKGNSQWGFELKYFEQDAEGQSQIEWGLSYLDSVLNEVQLSKDALSIEERVSILEKDGFQEKTFGTIDVAFHNHLIDWKFGQIHPYELQMYTYALGRMQKYGYSAIVIHEVYPKLKRFKRYEVTLEEAEARVYAVIEKVESGDKTKNKNDWCGFCKNKLTCEVLTGSVGEIIEFRNVPVNSFEFKEAIQLLDEPILNEEQMKIIHNLAPTWVEAYKMAKLAEDWAESMKEIVKKAIGKIPYIPGLELKPRAGKSTLEDPQKAFERAQIEPDKFFKAVTISKISLNEVIQEMGPEHIEFLLSQISSELPSWWVPGRGGKFTKVVQKKAIDFIFEDLFSQGSKTYSVNMVDPDAKRFIADAVELNEEDENDN